MTVRRHGAKRLGPVYRFTVAVLEPTLTVVTRRERRGVENLTRSYPPNDGVVVAPNHLSWFDPMNVSHTLWDCGRPPRFLAKERLFRMPVVGQVMNGAGQIPVYRGTDEAADAVRAAIAAVEHGECVVIYPEGTMTRDAGLWPMSGRTGAANVALRSGAPVIPMAQWGPEEVMRPYAKELRLLPRKKMISNIGPPVDLDDLRGKEISIDILREATFRITDAITALLEEIRHEQAPPERLDFRQWRRAQEAAHSGDDQ